MLKMTLICLSLIVLILIFMIIASTVSGFLFDRKVKKEVQALFDNNRQKNPPGFQDIIRKKDLNNLPPCVQKWLERSQVVGKEKIHSLRLKQKGYMRLAEEKPWMPVEAEQYFTVDKPGFIWKATVQMMPFLRFTGRDKYAEGKGEMLIKILSLFPVVNAKGKEIDQGTLLRYLAEIQWFPTASLSSWITWEEIDNRSARATMHYGSVTAAGVFHFDEKGDLADFLAKRYRETNGTYELTDWSGISTEFKSFNGLRIPSKADIIWKLKTGDFTWYRCEISEIEYNKPFFY